MRFRCDVKVRSEEAVHMFMGNGAFEAQPVGGRVGMASEAPGDIMPRGSLPRTISKLI